MRYTECYVLLVLRLAVVNKLCSLETLAMKSRRRKRLPQKSLAQIKTFHWLKSRREKGKEKEKEKSELFSNSTCCFFLWLYLRFCPIFGDHRHQFVDPRSLLSVKHCR